LKARSWLLVSALVGPVLLLFAPFFFQGQVFTSQDIARVYLPIAARLRESLITADFSRLVWSPELGAGFPLIADGATTPFYLPHWLLLLTLSPERALTAALALAYAGSALAMGAFARGLGLSRQAAVVAGIGYGLCGFAVGQGVHVNVVAGLPYLPIALWCVERAAAASPVRYAVLAGLALGLQCLGGHPQVALMTAALVTAMALWRLRSRTAPIAWGGLGPGLRFAALLLATGGGLAAAYYLPMAELASLSVRTGTGATGVTHALPWPHLLTAFSPFLFYEAGGDYVGAWNAAEMSFYPGVVVVLLAALAFLGPAIPHRRFFAAAGAVALVLALGQATPAYPVLHAIPLLRGFRAPARYALVLDLCLSLLAAMGVDALRSFAPAQRRRAAAMGLGLCLVAAAISSLAPAALGPLPSDRWTDVAKGALSSLWPLRRVAAPIFLFLAAASLVALGSGRALARALTLLVVLDLVTFAATAFGFQWVDAARSKPWGRDDLPAPPSHGRIYRVTSSEPWRSASDRALVNGEPGIDLYVSLPLRRHSEYLAAFWMSDQAAPGLLQAAAVERVVDEWGGALDPRTRIEDQGFSPRWPIASVAPGQRVRFDLAGATADTLSLVTSLQGASALPQGTVVATVRLPTGQGPDLTFDLRAGLETADRTASESSMHRIPPHGLAAWSRVDDAWDGRFALARFQWAEPHALREVELEYRAASGRLLLFGGDVRSEGSSTTLTPFMRAPYVRRLETAGRAVFDLTGARPRAAALHRIVRVADAADAVKRLASDDPGLLEAVALEDPRAPDPAGTGPSRATITRDSPLRVEILAEMNGSGYVVLADTAYPGWEAEVDGAPAPIYAAESLFRAVFVPGGTHRVAFHYEPRALRRGLAWSVGTLVVALGVLSAVPRSARAATAARPGSRS
jgi:hypothetical protein